MKDLNTDINHVTDLIRKAGLKVTHHRIVILDYVMRSRIHPSSEEVYHEIKNENPSLSLATVYQTLETLTQAGLISRIPTGDSVARYDGIISEHHHIFINQSREIIDFVDTELDAILKSYLAGKNIGNLDINRIRLHVEGKKIDPEKNINFEL